MDAEYLKGTVGDALAAALTSLALKQPKDPLEFVGKYLIKYADYLEAESKKNDVMLALEAQQAELAAAKEKEKEVAEEQAAQARAAQQQEQAKIDALYATTDLQEVFTTVLSLVKEATGATNAYLGKKIELPDAPYPYVKYLAGTPGNDFMAGKVLKGAPAGSEDGAGEEGVTFRVWKELPPAPEEENAEPPPEDAPPKPPAMPEFVHIENVVREPGIKFFGVPKLAAYLALPLTYRSGLHDEGIGTAQPAAEGEPAPEAAPGTPVKVLKPVHMVVGLDTFDQARKFTPEQIGMGLKWARHLSGVLEAAEAKLWDQELLRVAAVSAEEKALRGAVLADVRAKVAEGSRALEGQEDSPAKRLLERQAAFDAVKAALGGKAKSYLCQLSTLLIKPKALHFFKVAQAALRLLNPASSGNNAVVTDDELALWESVRTMLGEPFWTRLAEVSPSEADKAALLKKAEMEKIRAMLDGVVESELEGSSTLEAYLLFKWLTSLFDLTDAIYEKIEADAAAAAAAAAEAAAAAAE